MKKIIYLSLVAGFPWAAQAADLSTVGGWKNFLWQIAQYMVDFFWILVVVYIIYVAYLFVTSGGDPTKVTEARKHLLYALVGVAVALLATVFPNLICNTLGVSGCSSSAVPSASVPTGPSAPAATNAGNNLSPNPLPPANQNNNLGAGGVLPSGDRAQMQP